MTLATSAVRVLTLSELMHICKPHREGHATANFPGLPAGAPGRVALGPLRLCGLEYFDAAYEGFSMHDHAEVEIITVMVKGAFVHRDTTGKTGRIETDGVQVMSAGTGMSHEEFIDGDSAGIQIMMDPAESGVTPRCESRVYPRSEGVDEWVCLASGRPAAPPNAIVIGQNASVARAVLSVGGAVEHEVKTGRCAYVLLVEGRVTADGDMQMAAGERAVISQAGMVGFRADSASEILLIDLPA